MAVLIEAMRNTERSFSHWGCFRVPNERVTIKMRDLGRVGDDLVWEYVSEFECNGQTVQSRMPMNAAQYCTANLSMLRERQDTRVVCEAFDVNPDTFDRIYV